MDAALDRPRAKVPGTISAAIVLWVLVQTLDYIQSRPDDLPADFAIQLAEIFQFFYGYLIVALVA